MKAFTAGTRGSALALAQARWAMDLLRAARPGLEVRERIIRTSGDRVQDVPLSSFGEKGVFVRELENALAAGEIDAGIHSLKDLPSSLPPGFVVGAVPVREDPRDCLVSPTYGGLEWLPKGAVVGTGSPRRKAQLLALRPDLDVRDIRGNVDTRLRKAADGEYDAVVLAVAGLNRLGLNGNISQVFSPDQMTPAAGQGAVALELRSADSESGEIAQGIDDAPSHAAVEAERALALALGAGCQTPLGALAIVSGGTLKLRAVLASPDGARLLRIDESGPADTPEEIGRRAAERLRDSGAEYLLSI